MSIQLASTDTLQAVLAAAPASNQLPIHASYVDQGGSGNNLPGVTNGTTPVTFVGSPASGVERLVSQISICNDDTASATVTVNIVRSGTATRLCKTTLQPGYALYYDSGWKVLDTSGNFLCNVTVNSGTITANQGNAAPITAPWPVELSNGTNAVGTASAPLRIDPTGTTTQPVSVGNFPATQNVNISEVDGSSIGAPTAWGTPPAAGTQVLNVNANIVAGGGGGGGNVNVTEWNTVALGSPSNYGTSPGAVAVIGVNAFVTNQVSAQLVAGSAAIGTVGVTSIPALPVGSNTIGAVTQASGPWTFNLTQVGGTSLGAATAYGTAPTGNVIGVNANVTNEVINVPASMTLSSTSTLSTTAHQFGATSGLSKCRFVKIDLIGYTNTSACVITLSDGGGTALFQMNIPAISTGLTFFNAFLYDNIAQGIANTSGGLQLTLSTNPTAGSVFGQVGASN